MSVPEFQPGFRLSILDIAVLVAGIIATVVMSTDIPAGSFVIGFVVAHFFMFCNVFRIPRRPELIWAGTFLILSCSTIFIGVPGWYATAGISLVVTIVLIRRCMALPDYHGVGWQRINPGLRSWWDEHGGRA